MDAVIKAMITELSFRDAEDFMYLRPSRSLSFVLRTDNTDKINPIQLPRTGYEPG